MPPSNTINSNYDMNTVEEMGYEGKVIIVVHGSGRRLATKPDSVEPIASNNFNSPGPPVVRRRHTITDIILVVLLYGMHHVWSRSDHTNRQ